MNRLRTPVAAPAGAPRTPRSVATALAAAFTLLAWAFAAPAHAAARSHAAAPLPRALHRLSGQTSDEVIAADLAAIDAWGTALDTLAGAAKDSWRTASARAWLSVARTEYLDNDRTGFPQAAFERAVSLVAQIESGTAPLTYQTVPSALPPHGSIRVADSLYAELERLKRDPRFPCGAEELAKLETELAWAGNEQLDLGTCKSSPHLAEARTLALLARQKVESCSPPQLAMRHTPPRPKPIARSDTVLVPRIDVPTVEELQIPRSVHFALDKSEITPLSRQVIAGIAALLDKYPTITVRLEGHADSRGNAAYNLELSKRRVLAARAVFQELGVDSTRITFNYKGKSELFAVEDTKRGFALNRRVEMVFVDDGGRDIKATQQERDIQLESDRHAPALAPASRRAAPRPPLHKAAAGLPRPAAHTRPAPSRPRPAPTASKDTSPPGSAPEAPH